MIDEDKIKKMEELDKLGNTVEAIKLAKEILNELTSNDCGCGKEWCAICHPQGKKITVVSTPLPSQIYDIMRKLNEISIPRDTVSNPIISGMDPAMKVLKPVQYAEDPDKNLSSTVSKHIPTFIPEKLKEIISQEFQQPRMSRCAPRGYKPEYTIIDMGFGEIAYITEPMGWDEEECEIPRKKRKYYEEDIKEFFIRNQ